MEGVEELTPEHDLQAALVATSFVTTASAYFELADRLQELDEPEAVALEPSELEGVRQEASHLTARAAQLLRESRRGMVEHDGHGCLFEDAYAGVADFLGILMESGANLLELHDAEQIDRGSLLHPFAHFVPLLAGPVGSWLRLHADEEVQEDLVAFIANAEQTFDGFHEAGVHLSFGVFDEETMAALVEWFEAGGPHSELSISEPTAARLADELAELHDEIHDEGDCGLAFGQLSEDTLFLEGDFEPEALEPLLVSLEALEISYRLHDRFSLDEQDLITVWAPAMEERLVRRAIAIGPEVRYQLDILELEELSRAGGDLDDIEAYLSLDLFPGQDETNAERLSGLAVMMDETGGD